MKKYSISEVERLTGIRAHTIRVWEKRYNITCAERTETNIRFYSDNELKRFINIAFLIESGGKISRIASLNLDQLYEEIRKISGPSSAQRLFIDRFVSTMIDLDEEAFHRTLGECVHKFGFEKAMVQVIYPFLEKIGVLWQTDNICPVQEHFISNLIRQKIVAETDKLGYRVNKKETFLLFLPVDELHEIGLLFYNYYLRTKGYKVYYFGQSVPFADLVRTLKTIKADYLLTYFVAGRLSSEIVQYLQSLEGNFKGKKIFVTGALTEGLPFDQLKKSSRVENFKRFSEKF